MSFKQQIYKYCLTLIARTISGRLLTNVTSGTSHTGEIMPALPWDSLPMAITHCHSLPSTAQSQCHSAPYNAIVLLPLRIVSSALDCKTCSCVLCILFFRTEKGWIRTIRFKYYYLKDPMINTILWWYNHILWNQGTDIIIRLIKNTPVVWLQAWFTCILATGNLSPSMWHLPVNCQLHPSCLLGNTLTANMLRSNSRNIVLGNGHLIGNKFKELKMCQQLLVKLSFDPSDQRCLGIPDLALLLLFQRIQDADQRYVVFFW